MHTTLDIDEDILRTATERARITGRSPGRIISEMARRGMDVETPAPHSLRNGLPQITFESTFEDTADSILDLLEAIKTYDDLGSPLIIEDATRKWIDEQAAEQSVGPGMIAASLVQESLLKQGKWPTRSGFPQFLRRSRDRTVVTMELINAIRDEE